MYSLFGSNIVDTRATSGSAVAGDNTWHQAVLTWGSSDAVRLYLDGTFQASSVYQSFTADNIERIGASSQTTPSNFYKGQIDEIKISNIARSANWIAATYKSENNAFDSYSTEEQSSVGVAITQTGSSTDVTEGGNTDIYSLVLNSAPSTSVTITPTSANTGVGGATISPSSLVFTTGNWNTPQTVTVTALDDAVENGNHTTTISHSASSGDTNYNGISIGSITVNITDNEPDTVAPTISSVSSSPSKTTASIIWTTNELASSQVEYGATSSYGTLSAETETSPQVTSHSAALSGLNKCQTYHYRVISKDASGNTATGSDKNIFTLGCTDLYPDLNNVNIDYDAININDYIHVRTSDDAATVRTAIINEIWKGNGFPTRQPTTVTQNINPSPVMDTSYFTNLARVDELDINFSEGFNSKVFHLIPTVGNNRLVVYHFGHGGDFTAGESKNTIKYFLDHGFSVLAIYMPGSQDNTGPVSGTQTVFHDNMKALESPTFDPLKIFLEPMAVALNYTDSYYAYQDITMVGISGGGWATDFYPAIDTRIKKSFAVAGSLPTCLRDPSDVSDYGDYEQGGYGGDPASLYANVASFLDLYIMDSIGTGREHKQILNYGDSCCFYGSRFNIYETTISNIALGLSGSFDVASDVSFTNDHKISDWARQSVMLPDLKESATVTESSGSTDVVESGATDTYTIVLDSKPIADVNIALSSSDIVHGATVSPSTLTFTSSNWDTPQTITVTAVNGGITEGAHTATISHAVSSSDELYNGISMSNVTVDISEGAITYSIGGTISGLTGSVTLQNNAGDDLTLSTTDPFTFTTHLSDGASYAVTVSSQPAGQTCTVSNGTGTVASANITNVSVSCSDKTTPTLSVTNSPVTYTASPQSATVTGSVAGTVSSITYDGSSTVPTNAGTYAITADFAPTDSANYNSLTGASAGNFVIAKANQSALTFTGQTVTYPTTFTALSVTGGSGTGAVTYAITSAGTAGCSVFGTTLSYTTAGTCGVTATKAADANYNLKSSSETTFTISPATQATLTAISTPAIVAYGTTATLSSSGGSGTGAVTFSINSSTGCNITSSTTLNVSDPAGTCTVTATKAADTNYNSVTSSGLTVTLTKGTQSTLTFTGQTVTSPATFSTLSTTGGSGTGAVTYAITSTGTADCSISGTTLSYTSTGTCGVTATKVADANYNSVSSSEAIFTIAAPDTTPPILSNLSPTGTLAATTTSANLTLDTNETATCRYATTSTDFSSMTPFSTTNSTHHSTLITGLNSGASYIYYIKCQDSATNESIESQLTFSVSNVSEEAPIIEKVKIKIGRTINKFKDTIRVAENKLKFQQQDTNLANGEVKIYKGKSLWKTIQIDSKGAWDKLLKFKDDFSGTVKIKQYDENGNLLDTSQAKITVDTEKPVFTEPFLTTITSQPINFKATDNDEVSYYKVKLLDSQGHTIRSWKKQTKSSYTIPASLTAQAKTIMVRAYDKVGNYEEEQANIQLGKNSGLSATVPKSKPTSGQSASKEKINNSATQTSDVQGVKNVSTSDVQPAATPVQAVNQNTSSSRTTWWNPFTWF